MGVTRLQKSQSAVLIQEDYYFLEQDKAQTPCVGRGELAFWPDVLISTCGFCGSFEISDEAESLNN